MKKIIMFVFCIFVFNCIPVISNAEQIVIDDEMLLKMNSNTRNQLYDELNKQKEAKEKEESTKLTFSDTTIESLAKLDVDSFKGKALAIADGINEFLKKLGVTVNDLITTPAGTMIIFGIFYKIGVFGSLWSVGKWATFFIVFLYILFKLNTKKKIITNTYNIQKEIIGTEEQWVPHFSAIYNGDKEEQSIYATIGSIICIVLLVLGFTFI